MSCRLQLPENHSAYSKSETIFWQEISCQLHKRGPDESVVLWKPLLKENHKRHCLQVAICYIRNRTNILKKVLWLDETQIWTFKMQSAIENYGFPLSWISWNSVMFIMTLEGFSVPAIGKLGRNDRKMDGGTYLSILKVCSALPSSNNLKHRARDTMECCGSQHIQM